MQLTLCNSSYECYPYHSSHESFDDIRSISYGRAKCTAWQYNTEWIYVYYCEVRN
jgi:hypothetical protein